MSIQLYRVSARPIVLTSDRRIVMVTSSRGDALVLPGGAIDKGETLPQAALREAKEECGVDIVIECAIWLREYYHRQYDQINLEVYFLARPAGAVTLPDRWEHADVADPDLVRRAGSYSRAELQSSAMPVYPVELRDVFWIGLENGFDDVYLGRVEG